MKKSEAMDLYEGLNGISPKMIEEAGNYKKTALSLIHISEPTRRTPISYAVFCLKKKKKKYTVYRSTRTRDRKS